VSACANTYYSAYVLYAPPARLRVLHTQRAKEALTAVTVAVDSIASLAAAPPAGAVASDNPAAWVARQSAALLGVAGLLQLLCLLLQVCCRCFACCFRTCCRSVAAALLALAGLATASQYQGTCFTSTKVRALLVSTKVLAFVGCQNGLRCGLW
jgi:hypothetical protein